jgi:hypothetical protein
VPDRAGPAGRGHDKEHVERPSHAAHRKPKTVELDELNCRRNRATLLKSAYDPRRFVSDQVLLSLFDHAVVGSCRFRASRTVEYVNVRQWRGGLFCPFLNC